MSNESMKRDIRRLEDAIIELTAHLRDTGPEPKFHPQPKSAIRLIMARAAARFHKKKLPDG